MDNFRLLFCKKAPWCNIQLKSPAKPLMFPVLRIVYYFYSETLPKQWPKSSACWEISIRSSMNELVFYGSFPSQELSFRNTSTNLMVLKIYFVGKCCLVSWGNEIYHLAIMLWPVGGWYTDMDKCIRHSHSFQILDSILE